MGGVEMPDCTMCGMPAECGVTHYTGEFRQAYDPKLWITEFLCDFCYNKRREKWDEDIARAGGSVPGERLATA